MVSGGLRESFPHGEKDLDKPTRESISTCYRVLLNAVPTVGTVRHTGLYTSGAHIEDWFD